MLCCQRPRALAARALLGAAVLVPLVVTGAADSRGLVASCEDGSVVLAQRWSDVRCAGAQQVDPDDLALGVQRSRLPDVAALRRQQEAARERDLDAQLADVERQQASTARAIPLGEAERRRLIRLLAPDASVALARDAGAGASVQLRIAYSPEIEARVRRQAATSRPILVFALEPAAADLAERPPSFAQRGTTFRPRLADPSHFGWLGGGPGVGLRLGYVALPAGFDPGRPMAIFWGDAVAAARLGR